MPVSGVKVSSASFCSVAVDGQASARILMVFSACASAFFQESDSRCLASAFAVTGRVVATAAARELLRKLRRLKRLDGLLFDITVMSPATRKKSLRRTSQR